LPTLDIFIIAAMAGLLSSGFVLGDLLHRRSAMRKIEGEKVELRQTIADLSKIHNQNVEQMKTFSDRMAALEMWISGIKK